MTDSEEPSFTSIAVPVIGAASVLSIFWGSSWLARGLLAALVFWLLTGPRYKWLTIIKRTYRRDATAIVRFMRMRYLLWKFKREGNCTVSQIFQKNARKNWNKVAFYFEGSECTLRQIEERSNQVANYFKSQGFQRGDTVALLMESRPDYPCIWLGLGKIGVTTALINTNLRLEPLVHSIKVINSKAVIVGSELSSILEEAQDMLPDFMIYQFSDVPLNAPAEPIEPRDLLDKAVDLRATILTYSSKSPDWDIAQGKVDDLLMYIYTSGTTGLPKAAVINNLRFVFMSSGFRVMLGLREDDIIYETLPLYHTAGGLIGVGQTIIFGTTLVIRRKFSASNFWKDCIKYKCTLAQYIGEMCRFLLAAPVQPEEKLHNIRMFYGNGLRAAIWRQFIERFNIPLVGEGYGATESNSNLVNFDGKVGAVGFVPRYATSVYPVALIRCDVETGEPIRNADGLCIRCEPGQPGILVGKVNAKRAESQFSGYADPEASKKKVLRNVFERGDQVFNTGDILVMDELGYFYFKDRTGDTFRWRGENVATSEVEAVLSNVTGLRDAVVYGVEIPNLEGRAGMAAIVDPEGKLDLEYLADGIRRSLPAYARPIFLRVMKSLPMTGTYKLRKIDLQREEYNPKLISDALYFLDAPSGKFVPLTDSLYQDIVTNKVRL